MRVHEFIDYAGDLLEAMRSIVFGVDHLGDMFLGCVLNAKRCELASVALMWLGLSSTAHALRLDILCAPCVWVCYQPQALRDGRFRAHDLVFSRAQACVWDDLLCDHVCGGSPQSAPGVANCLRA